MLTSLNSTYSTGNFGRSSKEAILIKSLASVYDSSLYRITVTWSLSRTDRKVKVTMSSGGSTILTKEFAATSGTTSAVFTDIVPVSSTDYTFSLEVYNKEETKVIKSGTTTTTVTGGFAIQFYDAGDNEVVLNSSSVTVSSTTYRLFANLPTGYSFKCNQNKFMQFLLIGGGGGGGSGSLSGSTIGCGGGGGAGEMVYGTFTFLNATKYKITIGNGGAADTNGGVSRIQEVGSEGALTDRIEALGGGKGGSTSNDGNLGGSNGGMGNRYTGTKTTTINSGNTSLPSGATRLNRIAGDKSSNNYSGSGGGGSDTNGGKVSWASGGLTEAWSGGRGTTWTYDSASSAMAGGGWAGRLTEYGGADLSFQPSVDNGAMAGAGLGGYKSAGNIDTPATSATHGTGSGGGGGYSNTAAGSGGNGRFSIAYVS